MSPLLYALEPLVVNFGAFTLMGTLYGFLLGAIVGAIWGLFRMLGGYHPY